MANHASPSSHPGEAAAAAPPPSRVPLAARILVSLVAVVTIVSPYIADWNATHIYNPRWPPHAKFHNAQTMLMGVALGACALLFTWREGRDARTRFHAALLFAGLYWVTQMGSIAFPGTAFADPERAGTGLVLGVPGQVVAGTVLLVLLGVAGLITMGDPESPPKPPGDVA
jgi:hypothetical protein